jgi:aryl-alcohol dehydrogenase-like predicted oxidoreductase
MTDNSTVNLAGRAVSRIGLGTNRLRNTPENAAFLRQAVEAGIQLIDSAHLYTGGDSERTIGASLTDKQSVVVATKGGFGGAGQGRPDILISQIEQSLQRLSIDRIDLYYLHRVDPETPLEESLGAIAAQRDAGRIGEVGISDVTVEQIERARRVVPIAAVQNEYSLSERRYDAVVDHCTAEGIVFVPYFPLRFQETDALRDVAGDLDATPSQIALAWLLRRSPMILPIPGTLSIAHVRENLAALDIELTDDDFERLR